MDHSPIDLPASRRAFVLTKRDSAYSKLMMVSKAARETTRRSHSRQSRSYAAISQSTGVPISTLWHRANGRLSRRANAASQQYLTPKEENALLQYALRMANNGLPLPVKSLRSLALVIASQRTGNKQVLSSANSLYPPGKNWQQGFYKRHPELKARKLRAIDSDRDDRRLEVKIRDWFGVIGKELDDPSIVPENVYNMDETGVLLSVLNSLKVLVGRDDLRKHRAVAVKRSLVTAVECISADGRCLTPLIIWPAATHRSSWTSHPTPGWHYACSQTGYMNTEINLYWICNVFNPQTRVRAGGKPRILISDGFGSHKSLELMKFCYENRIILCRLPSHTSHKLQPCDVGVFGPLKSAYREQVERLYRGGAGTVDKRHFTYLYDRARQQAITPRNIRSGWSRSGLFPFDPSRHVREDGPSEQDIEAVRPAATHDSHQYDEPIQTPVTAEGLASLQKVIEASAHGLASPRWHYIQKLNNAAERVFAERTLLLEENHILFSQNNKKRCR